MCETIKLDHSLTPYGFPGGSDGKESSCSAGEPGSIPGSGRSPREFLPGKYHGQRNLVGYSSWGYKELNTTELWTNTIDKNKLKMEYRPKCKTWNHKTPGRKLRQNTLWHKLYWGFFLALSPKTKINKLDLVQLKSAMKETITTTKRQSTEWEKIFANNMTNKGLKSKIHKWLI